MIRSRRGQRDDVRRIVFCTGKLYYDLASSPARNPSVALVRVEELYPWPHEEIAALMDMYPAVEQVVWAQEEPKQSGRVDVRAAAPARVGRCRRGGALCRSSGAGQSGRGLHADAHQAEQARIVALVMQTSATSPTARGDDARCIGERLRDRPPASSSHSAAAVAAALARRRGRTLRRARRGVTTERGAAALGSVLDGLGTTGRVLTIAAHPDDEDTQFIAWLTRGRHVETAYLSLTRGDGGQNLIGNELGEALGAIRTQELLSARRIDGGRQYFTRAYDFGFSKNAEETYQHWPKDSILGDVVRVVRAFRPHVMVGVLQRHAARRARASSGVGPAGARSL